MVWGAASIASIIACCCGPQIRCWHCPEVQQVFDGARKGPTDPAPASRSNCIRATRRAAVSSPSRAVSGRKKYRKDVGGEGGWVRCEWKSKE
jgi:hypothetical protein